jgi:flagellar basal body P-ring protein FlgI
MTKHPKIEVNEKLLKELLPKFEKSQLNTFTQENFSKEDLINSILFIWKQANFTTNNRIEKCINKHFKEEK